MGSILTSLDGWQRRDAAAAFPVAVGRKFLDDRVSSLAALVTYYVAGAVARASDTYGAFATVIGLLSWFWLGSNLLLLSAEVNVVLHRRLWPRGLAGELAPADRLALRESADAARQDPRQEIVVRFTDDGGR